MDFIKNYRILQLVDWSKLFPIFVYFLTIFFEISLYNVNAQRLETQVILEELKCADHNIISYRVNCYFTSGTTAHGTTNRRTLSLSFD